MRADPLAVRKRAAVVFGAAPAIIVLKGFAPSGRAAEDRMSDDHEGEALLARLDRLAAQLRVKDEERSARTAPPSGERRGFGRAWSMALNVFSEFVGAIVVTGLIGWFADKWLGTSPLLFVVFMGLGVATGFWNIYRLTAPRTPQDATQPTAPPSDGGDERAGRTPSGRGDER